MQDHKQNRELRLPQEFLIEDVYSAPTSGFVSVVVASEDGQALHEDDFAWDKPETWVIPSDIFALDDGQYFKVVFISVTFTAGASTGDWFKTLRVVRFKPITATPASLRSELGATQEEMPNELFDTFTAFLQVMDTLGFDPFTDLTLSQKANRAIACQTILNLLPNLKLYLKASEAVDDHKTTRNSVDIPKLVDRYSVELNRILIDVFGYTPTYESEPLLSFIQRTDPFTGN